VSTTIFGRTAELSSVKAMLEEIRQGPAGLIIEGDIGAGKTTLWRAAVAAAREVGFQVLEAHPVESEASLPYAALGDLLQGVVDDPGLRLPGPQHRALRVAVLLDEPDDGGPDQRAVSVATLSALRSLSERSPVLVAVDDLQWMDGPSARVLEFAVRRLQDERIGVVAACRTDAPAAVSAMFDRSFSGREPHRLILQPLETDVLDALVRARLGTRLPRSMVALLARASGGNPLFALEIARGIQRGEIQPQTGELLAVPRTLQQYARERLSHLPPDVRDLLFVAAAVSDPTIDLLEAFAPPEAVTVAIRLAAAAGVLEVTGDRLHFAHPLFASTLYHAVPARRRRALHRQLAPLAAGSDERARHLALGADGADPDAAAALEAAARRASARGAPDAAAELAERAYELTPPEDVDDRQRRRIEAGEQHFVSGNMDRARGIFEEMAAVLAPGPVRASVLRRLAKVRYRNDSCSIAAQLLTRALAEAGDDGVLRAQVERDLAWAVMLCGDMGAAAGHAKSALELIGEATRDSMFAEVLAATAMAEFLQGGGLPADTIRRAISLEGTDSDAPIEWRPSMMLGIMLNWSGATSEARRRFDDLHRHALEAGEETSLPFLLAQMSEGATREGDFTAGMRRADEALTISLQTGQKPMQAAALSAKAMAEAHLGNLDDARITAHAGLELAEAVGSVVMMTWNQTVLGFIELSVDNPAAAHAHLAPLVAWREVVGIREPGMLRFLPDEIEALVALGELEKADALLAGYEADAIRLDRPWARLAGARCRALHTAAAGDPLGAAEALRMALCDPAEVQPFERARALFVLGSVQRRTRRRRDARESLQAAHEIFDEIGARPWAAKARRLMGGPGRTTERGDEANLTPAERRVAQVVAGGATNREAAARLFVSIRTVELHLTSVYRKLRIRSRTELAARLSADSAPVRDVPSPPTRPLS
jgi:DNA-binding CsgD family transcriptional regulator